MRDENTTINYIRIWYTNTKDFIFNLNVTLCKILIVLDYVVDT